LVFIKEGHRAFSKHAKGGERRGQKMILEERMSLKQRRKG